MGCRVVRIGRQGGREGGKCEGEGVKIREGLREEGLFRECVGMSMKEGK